MPTDEELAEYAARLADRLNGIDFPEIAPEHRLGTEGRHGWVSDRIQEARVRGADAGMTGVLRCMDCGHPIRDHAHCWCDLPRRDDWVPAVEMQKRAARLKEAGRKGTGTKT